MNSSIPLRYIEAMGRDDFGYGWLSLGVLGIVTSHTCEVLVGKPPYMVVVLIKVARCIARCRLQLFTQTLLYETRS